MWQKAFYTISLFIILLILCASTVWPKSLYFFILILPLFLVGIMDTFSQNNVLYNYPVIGHIRYLMEFISPEIRQYFLEDDKSGRPYSREQRDLIKKRAKGTPGTHPFGTENDIKKEGYNFALHSIAVKEVPEETSRIRVGGASVSTALL